MTEQEEKTIRRTCAFADGGADNKIFQCQLEFDKRQWEWKDEHAAFIRENYPDKKPETVRVHPTEAYRRH